MTSENSLDSENMQSKDSVHKRKSDEITVVKESNSDNDDASCKDEEQPEKKLSKREQKRIKRKEAWLAFRPLKRAKERERLKCKRQEARLNNLDLGPSRKMLKSKTMASSNCKIHVAVDMSFDDYMEEKDLSKCLKQLLRCYTLNRRADDPLQLYFTSFSGKCKSHMEKNSGYENWDVNFKEEYITDVFSKDKLVYLSSDSPNTILTLEQDKVYVIGGLVDHNVHKGLCHKIAVEKGISHAQLPIGEFVKMSTRKVLTVDHVFEIVLNVSAGLTWEDAFLKVIPKRKGAVTKSDEEAKAKADSEKSPNGGTEQTESPETKLVPATVESKEKEDAVSENVSGSPDEN